MKNNIMKKSSFISGAYFTTLGIMISKVLGILYVIFFYSLIGEDGGALYGYAYTIYLLFMSLSTAGIPLAISKITSEYHALGYYNAKKRTFVLGKKLALWLGLICFIILFLFAPLIAKSIFGNLTGSNTTSDVCFVIRVISLSILISPILSIYRGYFEGHRFMKVTSFSQVLEQIFRVLIIIIGSFIAIKLLHLPVLYAVSIALLGAFIGALIAYLYLFKKRYNFKNKFVEKQRDKRDLLITDKQIIKKIIIYSFPFIMIDVFKSLYNYVDMVTIVKALSRVAYYTVSDAEVIFSIISTWGAKFNMIIAAISTGITVSLIPNLTAYLVKNDYANINSKVNQSFQMLLFFIIPITFGISFLSYPIWNLFYGVSKYGPNVLSYYIFVGLFSAIFILSITILQVFKNYKGVFISLIVGIIFKILLNVNLISAFYKMGVPAYYGSLTATIIGYLISIIICLIILSYKYKIKFENTVKYSIDFLCSSIFMIIILYIISFILPINYSNRLISLIYIIIYSIIGCFIYLLIMYKSGIIKKIFGDKVIDKIKKRNIF